MKLREIETLMQAAAKGRRQVVIVEHDGKTFRGRAVSFSDWYNEDSGYAALWLTDETEEDLRFGSDRILYIELS